MKPILIVLLVLNIFSSCNKPSRCTNAVVTLTAPSCNHIGVILNGVKYPSDDLPSQYAVEGKMICVEYTFWEDLKQCPCCGGMKVHIVRVY